tara:strand:- start:1051 stop:1323 length:273 start_codon:yes stop_codon:yes gene_type:complete
MNNLINTPDNFSFTNEISLNNDRTACNPFNANNNMGNYFKQCQEESQSPLWGSFKPVRENCPGGDPKVGTPCHNIWNNQTKRKGVVYYDR